jgi:hypothetical protein
MQESIYFHQVLFQSILFIQCKAYMLLYFFCLEGDQKHQLRNLRQVVFESIERSNANFVFVKANTHVLIETERRVAAYMIQWIIFSLSCKLRDIV